MFSEGFAVGRAAIGWPLEPPALDRRGRRSIPFESQWRHVDQTVELTADGIAVTRWADDRSILRSVNSTVPPSTIIISIALASTRLCLIRGRKTLFSGDMPAGALHISRPSSQLHADFHAPFDFLHFHVPVHNFPSQGTARTFLFGKDCEETVLLRDPFAEQLGKALTDSSYASDLDFAQCVSRTLIIHVERLRRPQAKVAALPRWRLKRVEDYVQANIQDNISLSDLASIAGLSRMHFAAQFRAATGYRPHEFVLHQRIQRAKHAMGTSDASLSEVAVRTGFRTQAHFSTVFKRLTAETPARWREARKQEVIDAEAKA